MKGTYEDACQCEEPAPIKSQKTQFEKWQEKNGKSNPQQKTQFEMWQEKNPHKARAGNAGSTGRQAEPAAKSPRGRNQCRCGRPGANG